jgi:hypothetical protein
VHLIGINKPVFGGFRRFLPEGSPFREKTFAIHGQRYSFRDVESRSPPASRTNESAARCLAIATRTKAFRGHKALPFLSLWAGVDWEGNVCDIMHDLKRFGVMLLRTLVGKGSHGMYKSWNEAKDNQHRLECKVFGVFPWIQDGDDLPWRLSKDDVHTVNERVKNIWWPHYMDPVCFAGFSFIVKSDRCWKCVHQSYIVLVLLPTLLKDFVPAVHRALLVFVYALRRLCGQVLCSTNFSICD